MKSSFWSKYSKFEKLYLIISALVILLICSNIRFLIPTFDGAMNLIIAKNLAVYGEYFSFYFNQAFPAPIQTRFFLQLPSAFFIKLFGVSNWSILLTCAISTILFLFLAFRLTNKLDENRNRINLFILPLLVFAPRLLYTGLLGYGEIITYAFVLGALLVWHNALSKQSSYSFLKFILIGVLIGCAVVTKTIALIVLPAIAITLFFQIVFFERKGKEIFSLILKSALIFGFVGLTFASYEYFRFKQTKGKYVSIVDQQKNAILSQAGLNKSKHWKTLENVKDSIKNVQDSILAINSIKKQKELKQETNYKDSKILIFKHLIITANLLKIHWLILTLFLVLPSILIFYLIFKKRLSKSNSIILLFIISFISAYFIWWFALSPTIKINEIGKFRRLVPPFAFNFILISILLSYLPKINFKNKILKYATFIFVTSALISIPIGSISSFIKLFDNQNSNFQNNNINKYISSLKDEATIYGMGYIHSPNFLLFSSQKFEDILNYNFEDILEKPNQFLMLDKYAMETQIFQPILDVINYKVVAVQPNFGILVKVLSIKFDNKIETKNLNLLKHCLAKNDIGNYEYKYGFYKDLIETKKEHVNVNWSSKLFGLDLSKGVFNCLTINFYVPPNAKFKNKKPTELDVFFNGIYVTSIPINRDLNTYEVFIDKKYCNNSESNNVTFKLNTVNRKYRNKYLGIDVKSICLSNKTDKTFLEQKNNIYISNKVPIIDKAGINRFAEIWLLSNNATAFTKVYINNAKSSITKYNKGKFSSILPKELFSSDTIILTLKDERNDQISEPYLHLRKGQIHKLKK